MTDTRNNGVKVIADLAGLSLNAALAGGTGTREQIQQLSHHIEVKRVIRQ